MKSKIKILFICHGNICRSISAQYVMQKMVNDAGLADRFMIDSAATSSEELDNPVYAPMGQVLRAHGVPCEGHRARRMQKKDYADFDMLIGMDGQNLRNMRRMYGSDPEGKISLLMDYTERPGEVADPWYTRDFETTYRDVTEGCRGLLDHCMRGDGDKGLGSG